MENKKRKDLIETIFVFLIFSAIATSFGLLYRELNYDLIWCFHMSQKVANGYKMYSEISTVVMPVYFWLGGLFIKIFGNALTTMAIYGGVVFGGIATTIYKIIKKFCGEKNELILMVFAVFSFEIALMMSMSNYNTTAILWALIALYFDVKKINLADEKGKRKCDYLVGIFLALAFFTKQNIGTYCVIATGLASIINEVFIKKQNPIKEILRKASAFWGVLACFMIYFALSDTMGDFLNYCIGGLFEFGGKNVSIALSANLFIMLILAVASTFVIFSQKDEVGNTLESYFFMMCFVNYPLCNNYHSFLTLFFLFLLLIKVVELLRTNENAYKISIALFILWIKNIPMLVTDSLTTKTDELFSVAMPYSDIYVLVLNLTIMITIMVIGLKIISDKVKAKYIVGALLSLVVVANFIEYKNGIALSGDAVVSPESIYRNHGYSAEVLSYINKVSEYILQKEKEGYNVYVVSADASYYMANLNRNQYKYDLVLYGSLGYGGESELIEETSKLENAIILKDKNLMWQEPKKFDEYIKNNFEKIDEVGNLIVYAQ